MENLKKEFAMAAAVARLQVEMRRNPNTNAESVVAKFFADACEFYETAKGRERLLEAYGAIQRGEG